MRRSVLLLMVLISTGYAAVAGDDGIALSLSGSKSALTFTWNGGLPNYQFLRGSSAASVADVENPRTVTTADQYTERSLRPESGEGLVQFISGKPVVWVLGTHIEMTDTPFVDFPFGATVHPNEHELELRREHLLELREGVDAMAPAPFIEDYRDFVIYPL